MAAKKRKINKQKEYQNFLYISFAILVLLLSILNLQTLNKKKEKVLGINTDNQELIQEKGFWDEFLSINPTYYEGWQRLSEIEYKLGNTTLGKSYYEVANKIK